MNNAILAGLIGNNKPTGMFEVLKNEEKDKNKSIDFLSLFESQLYAASSQDSATPQTDYLASFSSQNNMKSWSEKQPKVINAWERPEIKESSKPSKDESTKVTKEKSSEAGAAQESARVTGEEDNKIEKKADQAITENENSSLQNELWMALEENPELSELVGELSENEKAAIFEALMAMDTQELEAVAETPETFVSQLITAVEQLPASAETDNLLEKLNSEEFSLMLGELASAMVKTDDSSAQKTSTAIGESEELIQANKTTRQAEVHINEKQAKAPEKLESKEGADNTESQEVAADESVMDRGQMNDSANKGNKNEKVGKNNQESSEKQTKETNENTASAGITETESLRKAFKRENQSETTTLPDSSLESASKPAESLNSVKPHTGASEVNTAAVENKIPNVEVLIQKLVGTAKSDNNIAKKGAFSFDSVSTNNQSSSRPQNNAGNGFANGFSQNQTYSAQGNVKQPVAANNSLFLSQLLEKAEMFKTSDGKKVLSLEMDPKELGKMEMELTSKDGTVTAKISAESELAKAKLEELAPQIKEQLTTQGINLTEITVDISSRHPDERNNQQMSEEKNKSKHADEKGVGKVDQIIRKNILPNLRKTALNIQSVDLTV